LLLAHKSYLCPKDYREKLWDKITLALNTVITTIKYQLITYNQLADYLLVTNINIRWLAPKTVLIACRNRSQAGQPLLTSSVHRTSTLPFVWEQPHDYTTFFSFFLVIYFGTVALLIYCLTILAFNAAHASNICFNCEKLGYCLLDCLLSYAFCAELKKLKKLLKSDLKNNKHLTDKTGKDTF
jgi:hypothetical protein